MDFEVRKQVILPRVKEEAYVEKSVGALCRFSFSPEWDVCDNAIVVFRNGETLVAKALTGAEMAKAVTVPAEVLVEPGELYITVTGYSGSRIIMPTTIMKKPVEVVPAGDMTGESEFERVPDLPEQIMEKLNFSLTKIEDALSEAEKVLDALNGESMQSLADKLNDALSQIETAKNEVISEATALKNAAAVSESNAKASETAAKASAESAAQSAADAEGKVQAALGPLEAISVSDDGGVSIAFKEVEG